MIATGGPMTTLTLVREDDTLEALTGRLEIPRIEIDGFVLAVMRGLGVSDIMLNCGLRLHAVRSNGRDPVEIYLPEPYAIYGEMNCDKFVADRIEMGHVIWFGRGSAGTPHVAVRLPHPPSIVTSVVDRPLDIGFPFPADYEPPIVRTAITSNEGWLYMDVESQNSVL